MSSKSPGAEKAMPPPSKPLAVARRLLPAYSDEDGAYRLRRWRGGWIEHHGTAWAEVEPTAVRKRIYTTLEHATYEHTDSRGNTETRPWAPSRRKVADVLDAMESLLFLPETVNPPAWLAGKTLAPAGRIVAVENGLLDVSTRELLAHTPRFFNLVSVGLEWREDVGEPAGWLRFLRELWPPDDGREAPEILALQEWFGYVLSGRTDLHKILLMIGPTRSGKGTIGRILNALVGPGHVAWPTLASLGTNFGLAPLMGKPLAIIADARVRAGSGAAVERLLNVSGEDALTVDRKFREPWTGKLPTRLVIMSNELPHLGDASGAIAKRFIVLTMRKSFLGKENPGLTAELVAELPAILAWALDGLDRLSQSGTFTTPPASDDSIKALEDLVSPVAAFVRDRCDRKPGAEVVVADIWDAWKTWAEDNGHKPGTKQTFGRDLRAAVPDVGDRRPRDGEDRQRRYLGLQLKDVGPAMQGTADHRGPDAESDPPVRDGPRSTPLQLQHQTGTNGAAVDRWRVSGRPVDSATTQEAP